MKLTLSETLSLVKDLKAVYDPIRGKKLALPQTIQVALQVIAVLTKYHVTLEDLQELLTEFGPFLSIAGGL